MNTGAAAVINNGIVENLIVIDPTVVGEYKDLIGCDYLVLISDIVQIGDIQDSKTGVFFRDGVRLYPEKTTDEKIQDLEQSINDIQLAIIELSQCITNEEENTNG